jgi:hypothetical protein
VIVRIGVDSLVVVLAVVAVGANPPVVAADDLAPPPPMQSARDLFNDHRKVLSDHVVAVEAHLHRRDVRQLSGGLEQGAIYEGMGEVRRRREPRQTRRMEGHGALRPTSSTRTETA